MLTTKSALGCLVLAALLAIVFHPRLFFGSGAAMSVVNFDQLFFAGQWAALFFAFGALTIGALAVRNGNVSSSSAWLPIIAAVLVVYLVVSGVPHPANKGDWSNGELGAAAFLRGHARHQKENATPVASSAEMFSGAWQAPGGARYTFAASAVSWSGAAGSGEHSSAACGSAFSIRYILRDRDVLQDLGLTWSTHAIAVFDSTAADAKIPVAEVACGSTDHFVYIRASSNEVWRWTNSLKLEDIKSNSFVLINAK